MTWKKQTVKCELDSLCPKSRDIAETMIDEIAVGTADDVTKRRYKMALQYILENGEFLNPIVGMKIPSGLLVLDGNHRMGAFCSLQQMSDAWFKKLNKKRAALEQDAWIGTHRDGQFPLT